MSQRRNLQVDVGIEHCEQLQQLHAAVPAARNFQQMQPPQQAALSAVTSVSAKLVKTAAEEARGTRLQAACSAVDPADAACKSTGFIARAPKKKTPEKAEKLRANMTASTVGGTCSIGRVGVARQLPVA